MDDFPVLTTLLLLPWVGAVLARLMPTTSRGRISALRPWSWVVRGWAVASLVLASYGWWRHGATDGQTVEALPGLEGTLGPMLGVDAVGWVYVVAVALLTTVAVSALLTEGRRGTREATGVFVLQGSVVGVILSVDLILWVVFWVVPVVWILISRRTADSTGEGTGPVAKLVQMISGIAALLAVCLLVARMDRQGAPGLIGLIPGEIPGDGGTSLSPAMAWTIAGLFTVSFLMRMTLLASTSVPGWLSGAGLSGPQTTRRLLQVGGLVSGLWGIQRVLLPMFDTEFGSLSWVLSGLGLCSVWWMGWACRRNRECAPWPDQGPVMGAMALVGVSLCNEEGWMGAVLLVVASSLGALLRILQADRGGRVDARGGNECQVLQAGRGRRGDGSWGVGLLPGTVAWMGMVLVLLGALAEGLGSLPGATWFSWRNWILFVGIASVLGCTWATGASRARNGSMVAVLMAIIVFGVIPGLLMTPLQPRISRLVDAVQIEIMAVRNPSTFHQMKPRLMDMLRDAESLP